MSKTQTDRSLLIQKASLAGIIGNAILSVLKISAGIISGSVAVLADGIDSATDILASGISYYANSVSDLPPDKKHPWGHQKVKSIASKVIAMFVLFAGLQLLFSTVGTLFDKGESELPSLLAIVVTIISIIGKASISAYQFYIAKQTKSYMVKMDAIHMRNDIYLSAAVLIGLAATFITKLPIIDTLLGICLSFWIIKSGVELSLESNDELMDSFAGRDEMYLKLFDIVKQTPGATNPHRARIRKTNHLYVVNLNVEVDEDISVKAGHEISKTLELNIREVFIDVFDVVIHIEPNGNIEDEQFGLCPSNSS